MMDNKEGGFSCTQGCWGLAVVSGIIAAAMLMVLGDWRLIQAIFAFTVITIILGALLQWFVCKPLSAPGALPLRNRSEKPVPTSKESAAAAAAAAREGAEPPPATPAASAASAAKAGVKSSKELSGEADLASREGSWKYGDDAASPAAKAEPAEPAPAKSAPAEPESAEPAPAEPAAKVDPAKPPPAEPAPAEPAPEPAPTEPAAAPAPSADAPAKLDAAREGGPDDLRKIKGVGPKMEKQLNSMGYFHFDQIASWTDKEVSWVDENLEGFKGRVRRDNWVEQARTLAAGGTTEFSDRINKGDDQ